MPPPIASSFAPELQLVVRGACLHPSDATLQDLRTLASQELDWGLVGRLGVHHQVLPLLVHHLKSLGVAIPEETDTAFKKYVRGVALQNMLLVEQLKALQPLLENAGIPVLHFKGPVLSMQAYGSLGLRVCSDLDLLVRPEDLDRVGGVVTGHGFMPGSKLQRWYGLKRRFFLYLSQQATFVHRGNHIHLDVHVGLAPPLYAYPTNFDALRARSVLLNMGGVPVQTFSAEDALVLLCLHGEKNRWEFLKYVTDISAILEAHPDLNWARVDQIAAETHTRRIVQLGLALAHSLLGAPLPRRLAEELNTSEAVQMLRDAVIGRISSMNLQIADFEKRFWLHLRTQDSLRDRMRYLTVAALRWVWDRWDQSTPVPSQ